MTGAGRTRAPLWLAQGSRFAGWPQRRAWIALALLGLFLCLSLTALSSAGPPLVDRAVPSSDDRADILLYESIIDAVRHGGDYYLVTAQALRVGNYPLRPFFTFRLPTLAMVEAHIPPRLIVLLLYALAATVIAAWYVRLRGVFTRQPPRIIAMILLGGSMAAFVQADLAAFHEVWAGLLIALSLAARRPGRWIESVAIALAAMLIRETAALYVGLMFLLALLEREKREALGWFVATLVLAVAVAVHAHAVSAVVRPFDPVSPGWAGMLGFGFFVKTMALSTALSLAPLVIAAPLVALALFGWSACRDPFALRVIVTLIGYAVLIGCFGREDTFYWGLLVAPLILPGLAFVPDGLRDLFARALDARRITVTRVVR